MSELAEEVVVIDSTDGQQITLNVFPAYFGRI